MTQSAILAAGDAARLATYRWPAVEQPRAIVVIVHGMAEHAGRYEAFAGQLAAAGFDVHAFDLRGHGATTPAVDHGHIGSSATWNTLVNDVARVRRHARDTAGDMPVFLFGHSLGSFIVQAALQKRQHDYAGAILSATDNPNRLLCRLGALAAAMESARVGTAGTSAMLQAVTLGAYDRRLVRRLRTRVVKNAWITACDAELAAYEADPQCGFALRTRTWRRVLAGIARSNAAHARRAIPANLPMLIVAGCDDAMGRFGRGPTELARALSNDGQRDIALRLYADARHELLHDHPAASVTRDVIAWLNHHIDGSRQDRRADRSDDNYTE